MLDSKGSNSIINVAHTALDLDANPFDVRVYHLGGSLYNIHLDGADLVFSLETLYEFEFGTDSPMWFGISTGIAE